MRTSQDSMTGTVLTKDRLETLSDGVFAVAMTLLVLQLGVSIVTQSPVDTELPRRLLELWPKFFTYFLVFLTLGVLWINHKVIIRHIRKVNSRIAWLNILLLMFAALTTFSASLLGEYWQSQTAVLFLAANAIIIVTLLFALITYTRRKNLFDIGITPAVIKIRKIVDIASIVIVLLAVGTSFFSPLIALCLFGIFVLFHIIATVMGLHEYKVGED